MRNFLLTLFVVLSPYLYALSEAWKSLCVEIKNSSIRFFQRIVNSIKNFFISIWRVLKTTGRFLWKIMWFYPVAAFAFCMTISEGYPDLPYADYVWVIFFFVMMITIFIYAIKEQ